MMTQELVNELVERFYSRLTQDAYYSRMFAERKVDIEELKARQRAFIGRLVNGDVKEGGDEVNQVRERHQFRTTPERAEVWLNTMRETMDDMGLEADTKASLLGKMQFLMNTLIDRNR
jgi:truncated hemoglobin YjbI